MIQEKQLAIRSTEAADLAETLARQTGKSKKDLVREGLMLLKERTAPSVEADRRERSKLVEALLEAGRRIKEEVGSDVTSDHRWMYDEHGLPK